MEQLLRNDFTAHYSLPTYTAPNLCIQTTEAYFEVEDTPTKEIRLHTGTGMGMARFSNPSGLDVTIANYDKFVSDQNHTFQHGRKRCDILLSCNSNHYFILGELKDRLIDVQVRQDNVRDRAKEQLRQSLTTLNAVSSIQNLIDTKTQKRCCYFNKQSPAPAPVSAVSAFNRLPTLFPDGFKMSNPDIEAEGFEYWEYTGSQTLKMTI